MGKRQNTRNHHTQESQEVNHFPAGDQKAARNRQDSITKTNTIQSGARLIWVTVNIHTFSNTFVFEFYCMIRIIPIQLIAKLFY